MKDPPRHIYCSKSCATSIYKATNWNSTDPAQQLNECLRITTKQVKFYDLGGGKKIRSIWDKYYHDAHGLAYVVDGADGGCWEESKELFLAATSHKYLRGKVRGKDGGFVGPPEDTESAACYSTFYRMYKINIKVLEHSVTGCQMFVISLRQCFVRGAVELRHGEK